MCKPALLCYTTLTTHTPRTLKNWYALLRQQRDTLPGQPSNRELQDLLDQLKNRGLFIEARTGKRLARLHLTTKPVLRWPAEAPG